MKKTKNKSVIKTYLPLGYNFSIQTKLYYGAFSKYKEHYKLEKYNSVLLIIAETEQQLTQQCLCDILVIDKVSMVSILDHLDEKGYINRIINPSDRRQKYIELTTKARKELPRIRDAVKILNEKSMEGLSREEKKEFYRMMQIIHDNLDSMPSFQMKMKLNKQKK